jgi:hypothetical protein
MKPTLILEDFHHAAFDLKCAVAAIQAVCEVEAPRGGFNPDDTPATLFEGHKFYLYTKGKFAQSHPNICFPKWDRTKYGKSWKEEQARLQLAMTLDRNAALMSASWGKFQIMGFNHLACGFKTVQMFVNAMYKSEREQLGAFINYVESTGLADELRDRRWADFARLYNGSGYRLNKYDEKLAKAFEKFSKK